MWIKGSLESTSYYKNTSQKNKKYNFNLLARYIRNRMRYKPNKFSNLVPKHIIILDIYRHKYDCLCLRRFHYKIRISLCLVRHMFCKKGDILSIRWLVCSCKDLQDSLKYIRCLWDTLFWYIWCILCLKAQSRLSNGGYIQSIFGLIY